MRQPSAPNTFLKISGACRCENITCPLVLLKSLQLSKGRTTVWLQKESVESLSSVLVLETESQVSISGLPLPGSETSTGPGSFRSRAALTSRACVPATVPGAASARLYGRRYACKKSPVYLRCGNTSICRGAQQDMNMGKATHRKWQKKAWVFWERSAGVGTGREHVVS